MVRFRHVSQNMEEECQQRNPKTLKNCCFVSKWIIKIIKNTNLITWDTKKLAFFDAVSPWTESEQIASAIQVVIVWGVYFSKLEI